MVRLIASLLMFSVVLLQAGAGYGQGLLKLGVLAKRGPSIAQKKWGPLARYLSERTGTKVVLIPLSFVAVEPAVKSGKIDFLLANPGFYVSLKEKYGIEAVATMLNSRQGKAVDHFGGVVFVRKDSPIEKLSDLKGRKFMCVKRTSFGGGQMAFRMLYEEAGINVFKDTVLIEGRKHDNVVLAVKAGGVDVGTVRSDTLERMEAEGKIQMADFRIIHRVEDDFPFVHSTRLYPEWPFAALGHVKPETRKRVAEALFQLKAGDPAAKAAKIAGWVEPLDYASVAQCLKIVDELSK